MTIKKATVMACLLTSITLGKTNATSQAPAAESATTSNDPNAAHDPGIYIYAASGESHTLTELQSVRPTEMKGSNQRVRAITQGIVSSKKIQVLQGPHAPVASADKNPTFYLYAPKSYGGFGGSGIAPQNFTLVKLNEKKGDREIVTGSTGFTGSKSGIDDKAKLSFSSEQIKPDIYKLTLAQPLSNGEYAFAQNSFTFFDFQIQ